MPVRSVEERSAAVDSLFRVRAVESPPDATGEKTVWHQGTRGADLLSVVNTTGHVTRQEFTLFDDYFVWTPGTGLRTGESLTGPGSQASKGSDDVRFDRELKIGRLERAGEALSRYTGQDRYLLHLRALLQLAIKGFDDDGLSAVTSAATVQDNLAEAYRAKYGRTPTQSKQRALMKFVGVGFGVGILLIGIIWMVSR